MRVAIYLRVSTARQLEGYGLKSQEDQCRAWIAHAMRGNGRVIAEVYVDGGVSGKLANRAGLDRMTSDALAGRLDVIVFGKLDRIGRDMKNIHRWVYDVTDKGVRVATADGRIDSDEAMFDSQLSLLAYMAEVEHALIVERTMSGRMQRVAVGSWPLGEPPFGIMLDEDGVPVLNGAEAVQIEAFADFMINAEGPVTREDAARHLNALGYRTRSGKEWQGGNLVQRTLRGLKGYVDFAFAGENEDGEEITTSYRVDIPKPLSEERAEALVAALARTSSVRSRSNGQFLLTRRLLSVCGAHRTGASVDAGRSAHTAGRYYRCMAGQPGGAGDVRHDECWEIPADHVEAAVWEETKLLMADRAGLHRLVEESLGTIPDRAASYRRRLVALDEQIAKKRGDRKRKIALLLASVEGGGEEGDAPLIKEMEAELERQETDLVAERERVAEWLSEAEGQEDRTRSILPMLDRPNSRLDDLTFEQRRDVLALLDVRVQITDKGVPRHKGQADPITRWHRQTGTTVPAQVTDDMWEKVRGILSGNRQWKDPRDGFETMLDKLRTGRAWNSYSGTEAIGGRSYGALYRRVWHWFDSGEYERALQALTPYDGVPVPPEYVLPSMLVTGAAGHTHCP
ncbi:recombinase family protein [Streptomyces sp. NPDC049813]|uniref:recombinase family protein n=1 Tax=Streptomyces sp. NPDC049813 TaxID=3365597 RepID=UPI00379B21C9